jgi:hypothetical protein
VEKKMKTFHYRLDVSQFEDKSLFGDLFLNWFFSKTQPTYFYMYHTGELVMYEKHLWKKTLQSVDKFVGDHAVNLGLERKTSYITK